MPGEGVLLKSMCLAGELLEKAFLNSVVEATMPLSRRFVGSCLKLIPLTEIMAHYIDTWILVFYGLGISQGKSLGFGGSSHPEPRIQGNRSLLVDSLRRA